MVLTSTGVVLYFLLLLFVWLVDMTVFLIYFFFPLNMHTHKKVAKMRMIADLFFFSATLRSEVIFSLSKETVCLEKFIIK